MKARQFDEAFDAGEDVSGEIDWEKARRPNLALKRVNVDFPRWVIEALDREARRLGVTRQALVKLWIAERLDRAALNFAGYDCGRCGRWLLTRTVLRWRIT